MSKIFIIGNGFDISMGMETSYENFLKSDIFRDYKNDAFELGRFIESQKSIHGWVDLEEALADFSCIKHDIDLFNDYDKLRNALKLYISNIECKYSEESMAVSLIKDKFTPGDQIHVFNYTKTVHHAFSKISPHKPDGYVHYVHGSIEQDNIIIGIDEGQKYSNRHAFLLKSAHDNFNARNIRSDLVGAREVYWFGHSLGKSDGIYFKDFFNGLIDGRIQGDKTLVIYHYGSAEKLKLISRIADLCGGRLNDLKFHNNLEFVNSKIVV